MTGADREAASPDLKGRNVSTIVARLGPPDSKQRVADRTAYIWTMETRAPATPVPATRVSYAAGRPNTIETLAYPDPPQIETCTLSAVVDASGVVVASDWQGSKAGCFDASQQLAGRG